jgi:hypothetical protein
MSLPSDDDLLGWFLRWLDDEHSDCASGEDLLVALFTTSPSIWMCTAQPTKNTNGSSQLVSTRS